MIGKKFTLNELKDAAESADKVLIVNEDLISLLKDRSEIKELNQFGVLTILLTAVNDKVIKFSSFFKRGEHYILFNEREMVFEEKRLLDRMLMRGE